MAIDVLAVMDADGRAIALLCDMTVNRVQEGWRAHLPAHDEARAAVAELIEADKEYDAALTSWDALLVTAAKQRRAAALARMGEGA